MSTCCAEVPNAIFLKISVRLFVVSRFAATSLILPSTSNHVMTLSAPSLAAATLLANLRTVIVRPATPENVGMIARSLRCCGITQSLTLLSPQFDLVLDAGQSQSSSGRSRTNFDVSAANPNKINPRAKKTASGAVDVLKRTRVVDSWEGATADCSMVIGASSRPLVEQLGTTISSSGEENYSANIINTDRPIYNPRECIDMILNDYDLAHESVAVVFGPEHGGLSDDELRKCDAFLCIPTDPTFPSLNLAMAVQIWAYEVRLATK